MLEIKNYSRDDFARNDYIIGSTLSSPFLPYVNISYDGHSSTDIANSQGEYMEFAIYNKPFFDGKAPSMYKFAIPHFLRMLTESQIITSYSLDENTTIGVAKGYIVDSDDNILLSLVLDYDERYNFRYSRNRQTDDKSVIESQAKVFKLLVSTELLLNPKYATFYKKLDKNYIQDAYVLGIPVIFTTSEKIEKLCYSNEFKLEFSSIDVLQEHLSEKVGKVLAASKSDFERLNPGLKIEEHQIEFERSVSMREGIAEQLTRAESVNIPFDYFGVSDPYQSESPADTLNHVQASEMLVQQQNIPDSLRESMISPIDTIESRLTSIRQQLQTGEIFITPQITLIDDTDIEEPTGLLAPF